MHSQSMAMSYPNKSAPLLHFSYSRQLELLIAKAPHLKHHLLGLLLQRPTADRLESLPRPRNPSDKNVSNCHSQFQASSVLRSTPQFLGKNVWMYFLDSEVDGVCQNLHCGIHL